MPSFPQGHAPVIHPQCSVLPSLPESLAILLYCRHKGTFHPLTLNLKKANRAFGPCIFRAQYTDLYKHVLVLSPLPADCAAERF